MIAKILQANDSCASVIIGINGHELQYGGRGDLFCYGHMSFDCVDNLSKEEQKAVNEAQ